ncbi:DUF1735 domain-containing protein [uncultured Proteiniphilum sp.]|uniref:BT_3987 domain-containing protein n=1 Tax=uncultured Proteiniphilum sp. TaxID=497637 RepID=UPI002625DE10|nr:DUF1735 domain-containing protein [uncultured Proteiniphilum sp.]
MRTVKHNFIYIFIFFVILSVGSACDESYRLHNMVDDQIYVLKPGLISEEMFLWDDYTYDFMVVKSGMGLQDAEVELQIDENLLAEYNISHNTNYQVLPQEYYNLKSKRLTFDKGEYRKSFQIGFDLDAILELQNSAEMQYVLPCKLSVLNASIGVADSARISSIIVPVIKRPYIQFDKNYLEIPAVDLTRLGVAMDKRSQEEVQYFTEIEVNYPNRSGVAFTLEVDPALVEEYNEIHDTSFRLLPDAAYSFDKTQWKIRADLTYQPLEFKILKQGLYQGDSPLYGEYILPLRITSVSGHEINPEQSVLFVPVAFNPDILDRAAWEIIDWNSCISEEPHYEWLERTPEKMLDGNVATFWGSKWDVPKPLPYYFIFDLKKEYRIYRIGFTKPVDAWRGNIKNGYFEISSDNTAWTKLSDWSVDSNSPREHTFVQDGSSARYIRFVISDVFGYANPEIGPEGGAQCDIAEFNVWGEE